MKLLPAICLLLFALPGVAQRNIDVLHYKFNLEVNDENDSIYGNAEIRLIPRISTSKIELDLVTPGGSKKGMIVTQVNLLFEKQSTGNNQTSFVHSNNKLTIDTKKPLNLGDTIVATVVYKGIPSDGLIIASNKYGKRTFFADNWPNRAQQWIPCVDDPADKASVEFMITAPSHYQVISNGVQIEETNLPENKKLTHYKETVPLPTKVMVIGVADFAVQTLADSNCIPVSSWIYPEDKDKGFYDYALARDILAYYTRYIGPYAYKKLANVQSKTIFGGMENAGAIFYSEGSVTGNRSSEALIAHEIVHQWFGNMATEKSFAHLWLSEGFATYLTHVYIESKYGSDTLQKRMDDERFEVIEFVKKWKRSVVDSTSNFMELLNPNSYQKGGWILHMLRRELGDSVFHKGVRKYYADYAGKNAETNDLQQVFETVSGKKLGSFFKQWLFTPENLQLDITWKFDKNKKKIIVTLKQLQAKIFEFPFEILVQEQGTGKPKRTIKKISQRVESFEILVSGKPVRVEADPLVSLLYEGDLRELK